MTLLGPRKGAVRWLLALVPLAVPVGVVEAQVELEAAYVVDGFRNVRGGERRGGELMHNVDLMATIDGEALLGVRELEAFFYVLGNAGGSLGDRVGDYQGASNIEAPTAVRIGEAWIRKGWDRWSLLFGLYDLNSEFYVVETGLLFLNSSHGIGPEFAESGHNGPSIFPVTSLAVRARWDVSPTTYALLGVFDGVPGDPARPEATPVQLSADEGALVSVEVGHRVAAGAGVRYRKLALGAWRYTAEFDGAIESDGEQQGTFGAYVLGEAEVLRERSSEEEGLSVYARLGYADEAVHAVSWGWGGGLVYTGLVPGRDADQVGLGIAGAKHSSSFLRAQRDLGEEWEGSEVNLEATYAAELAPWVRVQPNVQYIISPGMRPELDNALLLGLRLEFSI